MTKYHDSRHFIFISYRKYLICHVSCCFQILKNPIFQIQRFLRVGPSLGGGVEPGRADGAWPSPRPAQRVIFSTPRAQPARSVRFQSHATSARPRQRVSNLTGCLPGLDREILRIFLLFLRAVSPPRGFEAATCSLARIPRLLWGVACSLQSAYEAESAMPLYRPLDTVGAAWVT